ncbi:MAG: glucose-6-phosphate isomerase, partial [Rheinheimera sp.]
MSSAVWPTLAELAKQPLNLRQEFAADPKRAQRYALNACGIELDYSKNLINDAIWQHLLDLAQNSELTTKRAQMFAGDKINTSEQRSVWHTALRAPLSANLTLEGADISAEISACHAQMFALVEQLNSLQYSGYTGEPITDLIWIGIGGSLLGPQMAVEALTPYNISPLQIHFAGNIDGAVVSDVVKGLDPATTLVFVASKSFGTEETKQNALAIRQWFTDNGADQAAIARHF